MKNTSIVKTVVLLFCSCLFFNNVFAQNARQAKDPQFTKSNHDLYDKIQPGTGANNVDNDANAWKQHKTAENAHSQEAVESNARNVRPANDNNVRVNSQNEKCATPKAISRQTASDNKSQTNLLKGASKANANSVQPANGNRSQANPQNEKCATPVAKSLGQ